MTDYDSKIANLNRQWEHEMALKHGLEEQISQLSENMLKLEGAYEMCVALKQEQQIKDSQDAQEKETSQEEEKAADAHEEEDAEG